MGNKPLNPLVIVAVIAAAIMLFGIIGWKFISGGRTGPNGEDLSKPGIPPAGLSGPPTPGKK
jgi:hypothetical protein